MERRNVPDTGGPAPSVLLRARPGAVPQRLAHPRREAWAASPHFVSGAGFPAHRKDQVCPSETSAALGAKVALGGGELFLFVAGPGLHPRWKPGPPGTPSLFGGWRRKTKSPALDGSQVPGVMHPRRETRASSPAHRAPSSPSPEQGGSRPSLYLSGESNSTGSPGAGGFPTWTILTRDPQSHPDPHASPEAPL